VEKISRLTLITVIIFLAMGTTANCYVTVLLYHKFDESDSPSTSISSSLFAEQMKYLKVHNYRVMPISELEKCINGKESFPDKGIVITIDDGYKSVYYKAIPILRAYGYPYTVFIAECAIGSKKCMDWNQLKEIIKQGGDIGCHSFSHPHLVDISHKDVRKELIYSKKIMENGLGRKIRWFAYPFGEYDDYIRETGRKAGYKLMFTSDPGSVGEQSLPDAIPRQAIVGENIDMKRFNEKLNRPPLIITKRTPESGRLKSNILNEIRVVIENPGLYLPGQVQMFLSEKGRLETQFDPVTGVLSCKGPVTLARKVNRIITTARRKLDKNYAMDSYMIVLPQAKVLP